MCGSTATSRTWRLAARFFGQSSGKGSTFSALDSASSSRSGLPGSRLDTGCQGPPRGGVEGDYVAGGTRDIENAVNGERCGLDLLERSHLIRPKKLQVRDIAGMDLSERTVAVAAVPARVGEQ